MNHSQNRPKVHDTHLVHVAEDDHTTVVLAVLLDVYNGTGAKTALPSDPSTLGRIKNAGQKVRKELLICYRDQNHGIKDRDPVQVNLPLRSLRDVLPNFLSGNVQFIHYKGSLTTAKEDAHKRRFCGEVADWLVLTEPAYITDQQLDALRVLNDEEAHAISLNFRPVQPTNTTVSQYSQISVASPTENIKDLQIQRNQQQRTMSRRFYPTAMDASYVEEVLQLLKNGIVEIQRKNSSALSFEELYRSAHIMVMKKHGEKLYNGLREVVVEHLQNNIHSTITDALNWNFLLKLNQAWVQHRTAMVMIRDILVYLDRVYVTQQGVEPVWELGLTIFREEIVNYPCINEYLKMNMGQAEMVLDPILFKHCSQ
ncbi:cullin family domain-containing protein [Ditylenchus destructor]|nr:cullin family domain-containing protein [Ditylenchus destructor]